MFNKQRVYIIFVIKDNMEIKYKDLSGPLKLAVFWALFQMCATVVVLLVSLMSIIGYSITG